MVGSTDKWRFVAWLLKIIFNIMGEVNLAFVIKVNSFVIFGDGAKLGFFFFVFGARIF